MANKLVSGILHLAPIGPKEWAVTFFPSLENVHGMSRDSNLEHLLSCMNKLGIDSETLSFISEFDFSKDELQPFEFPVVAELSVIRQLGFMH